jgi:hypothetical protein
MLLWYELYEQLGYEVYCDAFDENMVGENENVKGI